MFHHTKAKKTVTMNYTPKIASNFWGAVHY